MCIKKTGNYHTRHPSDCDTTTKEVFGMSLFLHQHVKSSRKLYPTLMMSTNKGNLWYSDSQELLLDRCYHNYFIPRMVLFNFKRHCHGFWMPSYQEPKYPPPPNSPKLNQYHNQLHIYEHVNGTSFMEKDY